MVHIYKSARIFTVSAAVIISCTRLTTKEKISATEAIALSKPSPVYVTEAATNPWTDEELDAIALTLAGECYDDEELDKRHVCEVILNRVSDGRFGGESVMEVLTAENQFAGYWTQLRPVSENDYEVAKQALEDWYAGGCKALSEYLFFCAGDNRENKFRCEY